jgi:hypothetical protein
LFFSFSGHKSNFDGHSKKSISNLMIFPIVYKPQCGRWFPSLPLSSPDGIYAEAYINNTCILTSVTDQYMDFGAKDCLPGSSLASQIVLANNSLYAPSNSSLNVLCGGNTYSLVQWLESGSEPGTRLIGEVPTTLYIIELARDLLGMH